MACFLGFSVFFGAEQSGQIGRFCHLGDYLFWAILLENW
jgi:hypothetical protein